MLANQEVGNLSTFNDELTKLSAVVPPRWMYRFSREAKAGRAAGEAAAQMHAINHAAEHAKVDYEVGRESFEKATTHMPKKEDKKNLFGVAAGLGLGGLGFGYYQYKKNKENDQLAGNNSQVG